MGIFHETLKKINKVKKPDQIYHLTYGCGLPYSIEKYKNPKGFSHPCQTRLCDFTPIFQYAVVDGIGEPQGSFYYCPKHNPSNIQAVVSQYLAALGYTQIK